MTENTQSIQRTKKRVGYGENIRKRIFTTSVVADKKNEKPVTREESRKGFFR